MAGETRTGSGAAGGAARTIMRIGLAQVPCVDGDVAYNIRVAADAIEQAAAQQADVLLFPELYLTGILRGDLLEAKSLSRRAQPLTALCELARANATAVVMGFVEKARDGFYNTAVVIDKTGEQLLHYRKTHLWLGEKLTCKAGDTNSDICVLHDVPVGVMTCYDVEFPEPARLTALAGARVIFTPTANYEPWGPRHHVFITARAIENHVFVAYCNRADSGEFYDHCGQSAIIDPFGREVCALEADEGVVVCSADLSLCSGSRRNLDYFQDRRPELYSGIAVRASEQTDRALSAR